MGWVERQPPHNDSLSGNQVIAISAVDHVGNVSHKRIIPQLNIPAKPNEGEFTKLKCKYSKKEGACEVLWAYTGNALGYTLLSSPEKSMHTALIKQEHTEIKTSTPGKHTFRVKSIHEDGSYRVSPPCSCTVKP